VKGSSRQAASSIAVYPRRSEPQSLRWYTAIELAFFQYYSCIHYLLLLPRSEAVGGVPEPAVLYARPCGVPSVGREPEKRRFARSLSAHLRRQVQPHRRLLSRVLQTCSESGGELGERLHFTSHISAEEGRETVLFLARNRLRAPRRGASIRREIQALSQRLWNHAKEIGSGCSSNDGKRSATLVCTPEEPGVRNAGGIRQCGLPAHRLTIKTPQPSSPR